jgi:hypothetical protein
MATSVSLVAPSANRPNPMTPGATVVRVTMNAMTHAMLRIAGCSS